MTAFMNSRYKVSLTLCGKKESEVSSETLGND